MKEHKELIEETFLGNRQIDQEVKTAVEDTVLRLEKGELRVCEKVQGKWQTHSWIKEAILLYFRLREMEVMEVGPWQFYDKIPLRRWGPDEGVRVVPHALVRRGAHVEKGAILMPSYVNIGAWVGGGSMVDTWATVGSCAQIGRHVHLSGGVGIGGVLEPVQASPVIIEDNAFIGSRCIVVEGAVVEEGAILGAGVTVTSGSRIIDVTGKEEKVYRGRVPKNAVVVPGSSTKTFPAGDYAISSALIIGRRDERSDKKTSLTKALRDFDISV
ncbi:MAG: 2,3,4,5-tetrahydropyridine-2,6-dicarboxylate N-succinyltransferase [Bacteriovoracales bacterium]|nr:2,3,4,5-tetrahydropyridine-2,6-dicarboxylate N-succinyltransferase [Bacteriovoracales bacterium]